MAQDKNGAAGLRGMSQSNNSGSNISSNISPSAVNAASAAAAAAKPISRSSRPTEVSAPGAARRVWVRRRGTASATSLQVGADELVDDLKTRILQKYPTSLLQECDPADLVLYVPTQGPSSATTTAQPVQSRGRSSSFSQNYAQRRSPLESPGGNATTPGGSHYELLPDENVVTVVDRFFPGGMSMAQALEVAPAEALSSTTPGPGIRSVPSMPSVPQLGIPRPSRALKRSNSSQVTPTSNNLPSVFSSGGGAIQQQPQPQPQQQQPQQQPAQQPLTYEAHAASTRIPSTQRKPNNVQKDAKDFNDSKEMNTKNSVLLLPKQLKVPNSRESPLADPDEQQEGLALSPKEPPTRSRKEEVPAAASNNSDLVELRQMSARSLGVGEGSVVVPQINVLIVEDNVINQKILEAFMRRKKVRFGVARNGQEAVSKWRQGGYHLILMDIQLPVMTGLEATKEIRRLEVANRIGAFPSHSTVVVPAPTDPPIEDALVKEKFKSPVIIVAFTASADSEDKNEALAAGCNDFLTKPVNLMWLEQKIIEWGCMQALIDFDGWRQWIRRDVEESKQKPITNESKVKDAQFSGQRSVRPPLMKTLSRSRSNFRLQTSVR